MQEKCILIYTNIYVYAVCAQPTVAHWKGANACILCFPTETHTCSGHRSKAKASANQILTITCLAKLILQAGQQLRHLQYLHISCHASDHHSYCTFSVKGTVTPKARKTKYSNAPRGSWNHSILNTASADERQVISVVTTPTQWTYVRQC